MDLLEVRRIFNMRVKIAGMDRSDVSISIKLWVIFYFCTVVFGVLVYSNGYLLLMAMGAFIPLAIFVKILKIKKNIGHLEYLQVKLLKLKECKKNGNYSPYNLNRDNFIYKTKLFIRKPTE